MILVDTNVLIDVLTDDRDWADWSIARLNDADGTAAIDLVVVAELSRGYGSLEALRQELGTLDVAIRAFDEAAAFLAGHRFLEYRRSRGSDVPFRVLPDFFIGAHATILGCPLLTRDARLYRRYFPDLTLITPETDA